jgi:tetratricopeptide (TPR) repeat protein
MLRSATSCLTRAITPEDSEVAYGLIATANYQLGNFTQAKENADKAHDISLSKESEELAKVYDQAVQHTVDGEIEEASRLYEHLLTRAPKSFNLQREASNVTWMLKKYTRYKQLVRDLVWAFPEDGLVSYRRGIVLLCERFFEGAEKHFRRALSTPGAQTESQAALDGLKVIRRRDRELDPLITVPRPEKARKRIEALRGPAEQLCWDGSLVMDRLFIRDAETMLWEDAPPEQMLEVLGQYISRSPKQGRLYVLRGDVHLATEDYNAAIRDYNAAAKVDSSMRVSDKIRHAQELKWGANRENI